MKKLFLALFVIVSLNINAQYITNFAKNVNCKEVEGFYYHLPRNVIRVDFVIEKSQDVKGKYNAFTRELLGTDDFIKENNTSYKIKGVDITTLTEADPNYVFFISTIADEKNKDNIGINLELTSDGIIQSFGYKEHNVENHQFSSFSDEENNEVKLREFNFISIRDEDDNEDEDAEDGNAAETKYTEKEKALEIIEEIKNLRLAYFDLITGYQEVNYGNTINYMVEQIKEMENEYLSLFLGKNNKHTYTKTFFIIPEEGKTSISLGKFSDTDGFNQKVGENIRIVFSDSSIGLNVNKLSKDDIENVTYNNKIFYRSPANVTVQIMSGDKKILEERVPISQLGYIGLIPMNKMKLTFDTNTGQILSVIKE